MKGVAHSTFLKNRIGFCILHPDSCAGAACVLAHPDGSEERSVFPRSISPHQPFLDLCGISHEVLPGVWAELGFDGEVFETEDQRNWTDASYKTYCTPLRLPFPAKVEKGSVVSQAVTLRLRTEAGTSLPPRSEPKRNGTAVSFFEIEPGRITGRLPAIGLCAASHGNELSENEIALIRGLRPDHLRVELDLADPNLPGVLDRALRESASFGAGLHAAIHLSEAAKGELDDLRVLLQGVGTPSVTMWLVFMKGELSTADRWVEMARRFLGPARPAAKFAAGTNAYFTELNRGAPPGPAADCIAYSVNPQIHAFDDASIMETLSAQAATVECARRIAGGRPVVVSPVTLKARFNVVATGPVPTVPPGELPPQVDPRADVSVRSSLDPGKPRWTGGRWGGGNDVVRDNGMARGDGNGGGAALAAEVPAAARLRVSPVPRPGGRRRNERGGGTCRNDMAAEEGCGGFHAEQRPARDADCQPGFRRSGGACAGACRRPRARSPPGRDHRREGMPRPAGVSSPFRLRGQDPERRAGGGAPTIRGCTHRLGDRERKK